MELIHMAGSSVLVLPKLWHTYKVCMTSADLCITTFLPSVLVTQGR